MDTERATGKVTGKVTGVNKLMEPYQIEQMNMIKIGRVVEREWPLDEFANLEELRLFINYELMTDIQIGMSLGEVLQKLEAGIMNRNYRRAASVL